MARSYEKLGQFCDAVLPIETSVALNPARNDTSQTRPVIAAYAAKGKCHVAATTGEEVFTLSRPNNVVKLPVTINGVRGVFVLDTGATFVSLKAAFAQKAKVQIDQDSSVRLHTRTGSPRASGGAPRQSSCVHFRPMMSLSSFSLMPRAPSARASTDCVGMSFLSRFKLTIDAQAVRISNRKDK